MDEQSDSDGQSASQLAKESCSVNDLHPLVREEICKKLDIKHSTRGDYRTLAAHFDMPNDDIITISQNPDPTDNVLQWVGRNPKNTISKLKQVLQTMGRKDCVEIIDKGRRPLESLLEKMTIDEFNSKLATETEVATDNYMPPPPKIHCQEILQNPAARLILPNSVPNSAEGLSGPAQNNVVIEQDLSEFQKFIEDEISDTIYSRGHIDVFPELFKMENIYLSTETVSTAVRSVTLHPLGKAKEFLDNLDEGFMRRFEHFTCLNSQQSSLSSAAATILAKMLPSFELLEKLDLSHVGLDEVDVEKVLKALKSCKLKTLYLGKNKVGASGATALAKMLPSFELLEGLGLYEVGLDEVDVEKVLKALKSCKLKLLGLGLNKVGARGATALAKLLPSLELLELLGLSGAGFDEVDVEKVLEALKSCKLKILHLGLNKVGARGATTLAKMLPSFELLEGLYLSDAGLEEVDVEKVLEALKSCKKLKKLYLGNNKISARGATALVEMLPSFSCLEVLDLENIGLDEEVKTKLRAIRSLSKIKIFW